MPGRAADICPLAGAPTIPDSLLVIDVLIAGWLALWCGQMGGMLAATDPVAVCAVLNDLGCPDKLNYMIAGESLLNDGTAVVAFLVMNSVAGGCETTAFGVLVSLVTLAGGGVIWGLFVAAVCYHFSKNVNDPSIEISLIVFSTFLTFWVAENWLHVSGVLGTVVFGIQTARTTLLAMDEHSEHASHAFWHEVGFAATAMIFMVAGVASADNINKFFDDIGVHTLDPLWPVLRVHGRDSADTCGC